MKNISLKWAFPLFTLVLFVYTLSNQFFNIPAIGTFLNPFCGVVQNEKEELKKGELLIHGPGGIIEVIFDDRLVPHVFAASDEDAFFAQGYLTAAERLWQMDFTAYAAAGRLAEIFGKDYVSYDKLQRRLGLLSAAESSLNFIEDNSTTKAALDAYTGGVNQYIDQLMAKDFPFEYKLLDYQPEPWTNLKSVLIMKYMADMLSGYEQDYTSTNFRLALGKEEYQKLFPDTHSFTASLRENEYDLEKNKTLPYGDYLDYSFIKKNSKAPAASNYNPKLGSNNWVVAGAKTQSGNPILCNDPHLSLTFPTTWLEMQLVSNNMNVYGVSIPGTPGIIIGFNNDIAWGITNGATDTKDWYKLNLKSDYSAYKMDGQWKSTIQRIENIKVRGIATVADTIHSTIHGPIVIDDSFDETPELMEMALHWTLHTPSNEFLTFILLGQAKNYDQYKKAIQHFSSPVQNFIFAGKEGDIALNHQGLLYKKWNGQGKFILDGTTSSHLTDQILNSDELPQEYNPESGYLFSANNHPKIDSLSYLNGYYAETRANRLADLLDQKSDITVEDMKKMQLDNTNELAKSFCPVLLNILQKQKPELASDPRFQSLERWNYAYTDDSEEAVFFEAWINQLETLTWDELTQYPFYMIPPDKYVLLELLRSETNSKYFDLIPTQEIEDAGDLVLNSYLYAQRSVQSGTWGENNEVQINHLTFLEALSGSKMPLAGHPEALNATSNNWGPSWRMIVELGKRPKAIGIMAGGQSGNPASFRYDNYVEDWKNGNYFPLNYYLDKAEAISAQN